MATMPIGPQRPHLMRVLPMSTTTSGFMLEPLLPLQSLQLGDDPARTNVGRQPLAGDRGDGQDRASQLLLQAIAHHGAAGQLGLAHDDYLRLVRRGRTVQLQLVVDDAVILDRIGAIGGQRLDEIARECGSALDTRRNS